MHIENDWKDILVLGESLTQGQDDTTITAEVNFPLISLIKKMVLLKSELWWRQKFLSGNSTKIHPFTAKESEMKPNPLGLENVSKDFAVNNLKLQD